MGDGEQQDAEAAANASMFAIFALTLLVLVLIPVTKSCWFGAATEDESQPWLATKKKKSWWGKKLEKLSQPGPLIVLLLWVLAFALVIYIQSAAEGAKPFDPFEILGVPTTATEKEIKAAWRSLVLVYHPDKNPDPKDQHYFAHFLSPAYKALTDPIAKENYAKHGHPDGEQGRRLNVALPAVLFSKDAATAPWLLLALVLGCVLVPAVGVVLYLHHTKKYASQNGVQVETVQMWAMSNHGVKEQQTVTKVPDTLIICMEFLLMPTPSEQQMALAELKRAVDRWHPDLRDKSLFWKRRIPLIKAHMLLLAHLQRARAEVPDQLHKDMDFVLGKLPMLVEAFLNVAALPRYRHTRHAWAAPYHGGVGFMQCLVRALPLAARKEAKGAVKGPPSSPQLLQLPHVTPELLKKLARRGVRSLEDLTAEDEPGRRSALALAGLEAAQADEVCLALQAMPTVHLCAELQSEGDITEDDSVTIKLRLAVTRPCHALPGYEVTGAKMMTYAPTFPLRKEERWHITLTNPVGNSLWAFKQVSLAEAETVGLQHRSAFQQGGYKCELVGQKENPAVSHDEDLSEVGQEVSLVFEPPPGGGKYDLVLGVQCDCWVGGDASIPLRIVVGEQSRADKEGRTLKGRPLPKDAGEEGSKPGPAPAARPSHSESDGDSEGEDESQHDYDSDETGTLETGISSSESESESEAGDADSPGGEGDSAGIAAGAEAKKDI